MLKGLLKRSLTFLMDARFFALLLSLITLLEEWPPVR